MDSNDMNSWGEDPDELLRQRWQRTFAEFEVQSRPSVRQRILKRVTTRNYSKPAGWLAGGLLVLISVVLIYTSRPGKLPASVQVRTATGQPTSPNPSKGVIGHYSSTPTKPVTPLGSSEIGPRAQGAGQPRTDRQPLVARTTSTAAADLSGQLMRPMNRPRLRAESNQPLANSDQAGRKVVTSPPLVDLRFPMGLSAIMEVRKREGVTAPVKNVVEGTNDSTVEAHRMVNRPAIPASPLVFAQLTTPFLLALPSSLRALPNQLPFSGYMLDSTDAAENRMRRPKQWYVETIPLSSFQWMSTSSKSTVHLTQVNAPAAFSPATWGYQLNGGVRWHRWQAYLSIGQLRRWAYYTVNENQYRMEPTPTKAYQMVQEKHVVAENVALPLVGVGLSQYRLLAQGRYRVELGGQIAYFPMNGQHLASLRGGAGRRVAVSRQFELQAGLMAEYGLSRLMSEQRQLTIHPFLVGVGVRLQPRLTSPEH